ncbi:MAG: hypothetical protein J6N70_03020 [Oribacterium sp.]|nr:hypothetical protein [Oribacterium sp.]
MADILVAEVTLLEAADQADIHLEDLEEQEDPVPIQAVLAEEGLAHTAAVFMDRLIIVHLHIMSEMPDRSLHQ